MQLWRDSHPSRQAPDPNDDESRDDYIDRCTDELMSGDEELSESDATEQCQIAWENRAARARLKQTAGITNFKTHAETVHGMEFVLSDETPDRMGDVISADGWDFKDFIRNPIALFGHRSDFPIGNWTNVRVEGKALRGHLQLAPEGTSARIDEIRRLIAAGILKAVSVGFKTLDFEPRKIDGKYVGEHFLR
jgi:hypothetical protein